MNFEAVAESFRSRMPWRPAQKLFEALGLPRAQGWEKTIEKFQNSGVNFAGSEQRIITALQEHYLCGEKLVRLYHAPPKLRSAILERLLDAEIPESAFQEKYPLVLPAEDLSMRAFQAELINVIELADGVAAIFASVRSAPVREEINLNELPDEIASEFQAYEELVGIRHKKMQAMDVVWVPKKDGPLEVRVDFPQGFPAESCASAINYIKKKFCDTFSIDFSDASVDVFSLIKKIYDDQNEGQVVELAFGTTTKSHKHEKMRGKNLCLRQELYHQAGKRALKTDIEPHRLAVRWDYVTHEGILSHPELMLHTTVYDAASASPSIKDFAIRNCVGIEDYEFVRERILHHLRQT